MPRPRPDSSRPVDQDDHLRAQRLAALVSACHATTPTRPGAAVPPPGPVLLSWSRPSAARSVDVHLGGSSLVGSDDAADPETVLLRLPAGARARRTPPGAFAEAMARFPYWTAVAGVADGLLVEDEPRGRGTSPVRPTLEDSLLGVWQESFAWLVVADPVAPEELDEMIGDTADRQRRAQSKAESSPEYGLERARLEHRHKELTRAEATGLWRARILAGAATAADAQRVAALLCASTDLEGPPYALRPTGRGGDLATLLGASMPEPVGHPFHASSELMAAVARPPSQEIPGVRFALRPEFDVTPENSVLRTPPATAPIRLGAILDRNRSPVGDGPAPLHAQPAHVRLRGDRRWQVPDGPWPARSRHA
ncbi:hypothetical protein ACFU51_12640 [Streptomyces sp. NPDC057430]